MKTTAKQREDARGLLYEFEADFLDDLLDDADALEATEAEVARLRARLEGLCDAAEREADPSDHYKPFVCTFCIRAALDSDICRECCLEQITNGNFTCHRYQPDSPEQLVDGDMEAVGVGDWTAGNSKVPTNVRVKCLMRTDDDPEWRRFDGVVPVRQIGNRAFIDMPALLDIASAPEGEATPEQSEPEAGREVF